MNTLPFYSFVRLLLCLLVSDLVGVHAVVPVCPNECNGNGLCSNGPQGYCLCYAGYIGVDCSLRTCPSAKAFADFPSANNVAHADYTECSNMVYFIFSSNIFCYLSIREMIIEIIFKGQLLIALMEHAISLF
jgi:hypothetical protein